MHVTPCDVPSASVLSRDLIDRADFCDSYKAPLSDEKLTLVDIFFGIFGHRPGWMKLLLIARNKGASLVGLEAPKASDVLNLQRKDRYAVGEKIGNWPIFALEENELVAGRNNKHMDFRLSLIKARDGGNTSVIVSTICTVHNVFGKCYLLCIVPFHKRGVRMLITNAVKAKRL